MHRRRIAHFEILEPIGKGGMGVVYRARDTHLDRPVAIKVLPPSFSTHPDRRSRFLREARAAANLNHPNIATVYQFGPAMVDDAELVTPPPEASTGSVEILFLAMELVPGEDLHTLLESGPLPVETALDYAIQMARGLDAAHRAGVTHRDLKPKNVRITPEGAVKILDFGLAKVHGPELPPAEEGAFETTQGMVLGTPPYMAPEQLKGEAVDARSDLYALGVVLYQMFAGCLPFPSRNLLEYAKALASGDGPPSMAEAAVGPEHEAIVRRLLQQDPEARYPSARALIADLKAVSSWESGVTHPPSAAPRVGRGTDAVATEVRPILPAGKPGRARWWIGGGVLAALVLVAVLVTLLRTEAVAPGTVEVVVLPFDDQSGNAAVGRVLASRLIQELEGTLVRLDGVEIISHREAAPLIDGGARLSAVAATLGADCLLQGTLLSGDRLNVQLLQGEGARLHWNFTFALGGGTGDFDSESAMLRLIASAVELWRGTRNSLEASHFRERGEATAGEVDAMSGDLEMATYLFQQALEMDPGDAEAQAALSQVYYQLLRQTGDRQYLDKVRRHADRALEIDPDHVEAHIARGRYLRFEGAFEESITELERAVALAPTSDLAWFELAASQYRDGQGDAAISTLQKVITMRPDYWYYKNQLATVLMGTGRDLQQARNLLTEAVELAGPQSSWPLNNWAVLEIETGNFTAAATLLERIPRPFTDPDFPTNLGNAYFYLGDMERAAAYFEQAIAMDDGDSGYFRNLGDVYLELGRLDEAREQFARAAEQIAQEKDAPPWRRPLYLAKAERCAESLEVTDQVAASLRGQAWWNIGAVDLAKARTLCGDLEGALDLLEEVTGGEELRALGAEPEFESIRGEPRFQRLTRP